MADNAEEKHAEAVIEEEAKKVETEREAVGDNFKELGAKYVSETPNGRVTYDWVGLHGLWMGDEDVFTIAQFCRKYGINYTSKTRPKMSGWSDEKTDERNRRVAEILLKVRNHADKEISAMTEEFLKIAALIPKMLKNWLVSERKMMISPSEAKDLVHIILLLGGKPTDIMAKYDDDDMPTNEELLEALMFEPEKGGDNDDEDSTATEQDND
jgi:hypothetical protein